MLRIEDVMQWLKEVHDAHGNVPVFLMDGDENIEAGLNDLTYNEDLGRVMIGDSSL